MCLVPGSGKSIFVFVRTCMCAVTAAASDDAVPSKSTPASRFLVMDVLDQLIDDTDVNAPLSADWYLAITPPPHTHTHTRHTSQAVPAGGCSRQ